MISRLFDAMEALGCFTESLYSSSSTVTVTNLQHVTIGLKSPKALKTITEALEAAVKTNATVDA